MTIEEVAKARGDIEATGGGGKVREPIVMTWEEWQASREAKRENLRRLGLDAPSRRTTDYSTSARRLRAAFGGERAPKFCHP